MSKCKTQKSGSTDLYTEIQMHWKIDRKDTRGYNRTCRRAGLGLKEVQLIVHEPPQKSSNMWIDGPDFLLDSYSASSAGHLATLTALEPFSY